MQSQPETHQMARMMNKVCLIVCLLAALAVLALAGDERPVGQSRERQPNIIMIYADDLGWGDVGFNGRTEWRTPNLDRLAAQGTVFRRWYTGAVVCAPSRAALLTGKYTIHNGVSANNADLPRQEVTIAEALKPLGYATALFGKWHHGRTRPGESDYVHPLDQGFDEFCGYTDAGHAWEHFPRQLWFGRELKPVTGYAATLLTDRSIDFVKRHQQQPFFLYLPTPRAQAVNDLPKLNRPAGTGNAITARAGRERPA
ncbi:MAG: sulfatase-like hydrolase/transferase [Blastocatellia bacterium]